jgi:all-trans-retinol 13,14-reductase
MEFFNIFFYIKYFIYIYIPIIIIFIFIVGLLNHFINIKHRVNKAKHLDSSNNSTQGFTANKVKDQNFDAIVIGSGIGGLSTAALLSRSGKKVLVLEAHPDVAGGCLHTFTEKGYEFDTGIHYIGGEVGKKKSLLGYLFHLLTLGNTTWSKLEKCFDEAKISDSLEKQTQNIIKNENTIRSMEIISDNVSGEESFKNSLINQFPDEVNGIESYFNIIKKAEVSFSFYVALKLIPYSIAKLFRSLFDSYLFAPYLTTSTANVINSCTKNVALAGILTWLYGDYGLSPMESCFIITALITNHYLSGAYYPDKGPNNIVESIISQIKASDGQVLIRAAVSHIILNDEGTEAVGVHVRGIDIVSPIIVSSAGVINTYTKLIKKEVKCNIADQIRNHLSLPVNPEDNNGPIDTNNKLQPSCAMISVFVGLKGTQEELKLPRKNLWLFPNWEHDLSFRIYQESLKTSTIGNCYIPLVFISSSSAKDLKWSEKYPDKSVVEILSVTDYYSFENQANRKSGHHINRGGEYSNEKTILESRLLKVFEAEFPHLVDKIDFIKSGTPLTNNYYLNSVFGEVYGLGLHMSRFSSTFESFLRPKQEIKGLYLTGQDIITNGVAGGLFGGVMTSIIICPWVLLDLIITYVVEYLFY